MAKENKKHTHRKLLRIFTLLVIVTNGTLTYFDIIAFKQAVFITIFLECLIGIIFVFFLSQGIRSYRSARNQGLGFSASLSRFADEVIPNPVIKLAKHESSMWRLVGYLLRRKINIPPNAIAFNYGSEQRAIYFVLIMISIIEIIVVELIIPWHSIRIFVLVISIYGAIWLLLFFMSFRINPHYIDEKSVVLRIGLLEKLSVPLDEIKHVRSLQKTWNNKFLSIGNNEAVIKHGSDTNIEIVLHSPILLVSQTNVENTEPVERIYCAFDDPKNFIQKYSAAADKTE